MAMILDKEALETMKRTCGKRLRKARVAARITAEQAQNHIGHKNLTQISLAESGERLLPLPQIVALADLYGVPMDYIVGRIDDPLAEPFEVAHGVMVGLVKNSISASFEKFASATAEHVAVSLAGQRQDRVDVLELIKLSEQLCAAYKTFKRLNPDYEDDARGAAKVENIIERIAKLAHNASRRVENDQKLVKMIDRDISPSEIEKGAEQFILKLTEATA